MVTMLFYLYITESLDTAPTVGFISENLILDNYDIKIFDLGGGKKIRNIWKQYFVEVYGIIYVVDSSSPERIEETNVVLKELLEHDKIGGKPLLVYVLCTCIKKNDLKNILAFNVSPAPNAGTGTFLFSYNIVLYI
jgi:signal recognition particle receptor subunit beta